MRQFTVDGRAHRADGLGDLAAALRQFTVDGRARRADGVSDLAAAGVQFVCQLGCRACEGFGRLVAGVRNVLGHLRANPAQGFADPFGVVCKRIALTRQFPDQTSDPQLVIGIGAFKRGNLIMNQRFQLAGAPQRARNRVIHGGHLPPDRLAERRHRLGGHFVRFGKPHRDFRHRRRHEAQFLCPPDQQCQEPEQGNGNDQGRPECQGCGIAQHIAAG